MMSTIQNTDAHNLFLSIGFELEQAQLGKLFGKPCFKVVGKAFVCFFQDEMVFKLTDSVHKEALNLDGAKLFDPSGKKRPMKEWVQVPFAYKTSWKELAQAAICYVQSTLG